MSRVIVLFSVIFALLPGMIVFLASFSAGNSLAFPPREFTLHWYGVILGDPEFSSALLMSVMLAGVTSVVATAARRSGVSSLGVAASRSRWTDVASTTVPDRS